MDEVVFRDGADHMIQVVVRKSTVHSKWWECGLLHGGGDKFLLLEVFDSKEAAAFKAMEIADEFVTERNIFVLADGVEVFATFYLKEIIMEPAADVPEAVKAAMAAQKGVH